MKVRYSTLLLILLPLFITGCWEEPPKPKVKKVRKIKKVKKAPPPPREHILKVTATAYTSCESQTDETPFLAAWNNLLLPGFQSIAVSRDLLAMGLGNGSYVTIDELNGSRYKVLDKMNKRWKKKIDIYMGCEHQKALEWGVREVTIRWPREG